VKQAILAPLAGAALVFSFAPFPLGIWALAPAALLYHWLFSARSSWHAAGLGAGFFLGLYAAGVSWLYVSVSLFSGLPAWLSAGFTALFILALSLFGALQGAAFAALRPAALPPWLPPLLFAAVWTGVEWLRGRLFTGFPWLTLGYSQSDTWLRGFVPVGGVLLASFVTALCAAWLMQLSGATRARLPRRAAASAVSLLALWAAGAALIHAPWTQDTGASLDVALLQGNVQQRLKWRPEQKAATLVLYAGMTREVWGHDLILWPETAIPDFAHRVRDFLDDLRAESLEHRGDVLIGLPVRSEDGDRYYNALLSLKHPNVYYHKRHLVPFGEYLPWRELIGPLARFLGVRFDDYSTGTSLRPLLHLDGVPAGMSICYEDIFGEEMRQALPEAAYLINVSNDAWFGDSLAPHQHLQMARLRALETGRWLLRATNTGISALIAPDGRIARQAPQFERHTLTGRITLREGATPYVRWGDAPLLTVLTLCLLAAAVWRRRVAA
jgi:apolipoprotein N-acyltransferase